MVVRQGKVRACVRVWGTAGGARLGTCDSCSAPGGTINEANARFSFVSKGIAAV